MLTTLKIPTSVLTATGNGWVIDDGSKNFFINYREVLSTDKIGDDYFLKMTEMAVDAPGREGLRDYALPA